MKTNSSPTSSGWASTGTKGPTWADRMRPIVSPSVWRFIASTPSACSTEGKAYLCFCSEEDLQRERERAQAEHRQPIYSGKCRAIDPAEAGKRRTAGESCAIRLRIPEHPIRFHDIVHGDVEFSNEVVSDPIILRSNGMPVYNYVVVIDDALMKITHVIRGDDHLSNTPKQVALYEALGWPVPEFAHLSTILGSDRERLSKRHGATSIANFRDMGVLPEALVNYLALLGWAPTGGTREIFSPRRVEEGIFPRAGDASRGHVRHGEAVLAEPALHQKLAGGKSDRAGRVVPLQGRLHRTERCEVVECGKLSRHWLDR